MSDHFVHRALTYKRFAMSRAISNEVLETVIDADVHITHELGVLMIKLTKELLTDRIKIEDHDIEATAKLFDLDFPRSVLVELPRRWWQKLLRRPATNMWIDVAGTAMGVTAKVKVRVRAEFFETFPLNSLRYPPEFGRPIPLAMLDPDALIYADGADGEHP